MPRELSTEENKNILRNFIAGVCVSEVLICAKLDEQKPVKADFDKFFALKNLHIKQVIAWYKFEEEKITEEQYMEVIDQLRKEHDAL